MHVDWTSPSPTDDRERGGKKGKEEGRHSLRHRGLKEEEPLGHTEVHFSYRQPSLLIVIICGPPPDKNRAKEVGSNESLGPSPTQARAVYAQKSRGLLPDLSVTVNRLV